MILFLVLAGLKSQPQDSWPCDLTRTELAARMLRDDMVGSLNAVHGSVAVGKILRVDTTSKKVTEVKG